MSNDGMRNKDKQLSEMEEIMVAVLDEETRNVDMAQHRWNATLAELGRQQHRSRWGREPISRFGKRWNMGGVLVVPGSRGVAIAAVFLVALVAAVVVTVGPPFTGEASAAERLEQAIDETTSLSSWQMTVTGWQTDGEGNVFERHTVFQQVLPWDSRILTYDEDGQLINKAIVKGEEGYAYGSLTLDPPTWRRLGASFPDGYPSSVPSTSLQDRTLEYLKDVEAVGREEVAGDTLIHLRGQTDMARKGEFIWPPEMLQRMGGSDGAREQLLSAREVVDIWISESTDLLVRYRVQGTYPTVGTFPGYDMDFTYEYSHYNEPFVIEAPPADQIVADEEDENR